MTGMSGFKARNHPRQVEKRGPSLFGDDETEVTDDRSTDWLDFKDFAQIHGPFTLDVAATSANTKCDRYFTRSDNGLRQPWADERVWCNPPYSDIGSWVCKAWSEYRNGCDLIVMLLPANRTEQNWWQDEVEPFRDRDLGLSTVFLRGRLRFIRPGRTVISGNDRPPFGCCLLIWKRL